MFINDPVFFWLLSLDFYRETFIVRLHPMLIKGVFLRRATVTDWTDDGADAGRQNQREWCDAHSATVIMTSLAVNWWGVFGFCPVTFYELSGCWTYHWATERLKLKPQPGEPGTGAPFLTKTKLFFHRCFQTDRSTKQRLTLVPHRGWMKGTVTLLVHGWNPQ